MSIRKLPALLGILSLIGLAFGVGYISYPLLHGAPQIPAVTAPRADAPNAGGDMGVYWDAWDILDRDFMGAKPDATARTYGAIRGMVASFNDPYTYFVEPQPRELERDDLAGKFGGIGANVEATAEGYILRPVPGQPAAEAGILDGDLLLLVDGREVTPATPADELSTWVRGPVGSVVALVVRRTPAEGGAPIELTFDVTRIEIETPSVEWRMLAEAPSGKVGYLRHTLFTERSAEEMARAVQELEAQGATRYILDLRGNRGGLVSTALAIADMWLDEGVIFIEEKADGAGRQESATPGMVVDAPLVVLVDGGSASAAEIVAGALQDHGRALLVGEKTYGKGSVQLIHELPDQSSLHVTNAQWYTPKHRPISGHGLEPDIAIAPGIDPLGEAIAAVESAPLAQAQPAADH
jgi:carboxyl-terminal processing protease